MVKPNASGMGSTARFRGILQKGKRTEAYLFEFGRALGFGGAWLDEVAGEQAGGVALGGVLLEALHQFKA